MPDPPPLPEGTIIAGKLRVVRLLGAGGMGSVYEVEHEFTKHRRALKMLHAEMLEHPTVVARFVREASAAGHIGNPHIVETFDAGKLEGGEPYIVMEMLKGESLADRLEKVRRLALPELVDVIRQACDGVQAAHDAGIVHRDLKPDNLFLIEKDGKPFVKILDFGVSKFDPTLTGGADGTTKEGSALGTPYYMSPEQVDGDKDLDARTDVYALGVILYQCACGRRPFKADALPKLAVLIHEGKPAPLSERRPELPIGFVEVVHKAMARDRDARFATPRELAAALEPFSAVALDVTVLETSAVRGAGSSKPPPPIAIAQSERPPEPTQDAKRPGLTVGGSALSVAMPETSPRAGAAKKARGGTMAVVAIGVALLAAATVVVVGRGSTGAAGNAGGATPQATQVVTAEPPAVASPSSSAVALTPLPSATPAATATATASAKAGAVAVTAPVGSTKRGVAMPAVSASTGPRTGPSRAEQKGLAGDNPF